MTIYTNCTTCSGSTWYTVILHSDVRKQMLSQHGLLCKFSGQYFQVDSFLILQTSPYCNCNTKHLPISKTENSEFWRVFKGLLKECCVLWLPCHRDYQNVLNIMVVPTECHIQTVMINMNFHEHGIHMSVYVGVNTVISQMCWCVLQLCWCVLLCCKNFVTMTALFK